MSRSPFAYPMVRNVDSDAGGAADLQTDVMRFMAILALCLMAIFALVQSIPLAPVQPAEPEATEDPEVNEPEPAPVVATPSKSAAQPVVRKEPEAENLVLTRPAWKTTFKPAPKPDPAPLAESATASPVPVPAEPEVAKEPEGFTLRFESDQALMRLVAQSKVSLYAIDGSRALRMAVSASRISFWDASTPNEFHEMEAKTVPAPVIDALGRNGGSGNAVAWGVTLPGKMRAQLDTLMRDNSGGALIIGKDGSLRLESGK
ncbi:MAG: hypothetical protein QNJ07_00380 [Woeseiaceae bacterium]|nr:hypothetical protein [Woeseiaceae bacterium]